MSDEGTLRPGCFNPILGDYNREPLVGEVEDNNVDPVSGSHRQYASQGSRENDGFVGCHDGGLQGLR